VADQHAPIKGKFVADVGHYNPHSSEFSINEDEVTTWLAKGAQPTATVHNLMVTKGFLKEDKVTSWSPKKKPATDESDEPAEKPSPDATEDKKDEKEATDTPAESEESKK